MELQGLDQAAAEAAAERPVEELPGAPVEDAGTNEEATDEGAE